MTSRDDRDGLERVLRYHDGTKHHFHRFAAALPSLDWASQPRPFRSFKGAPVLALSGLPAIEPPGLTYDRLFSSRPLTAVPVTAATIGHFLRHALGLSAWKVFEEFRWSLRVNPSSGNLHPTEAYVVSAPLPETNGSCSVWHYAPDRHALERRCAFAPEGWRMIDDEETSGAFLVALTSIHWRESWKYGERAFRYCQHDLGHAIAALRLSAALCGWRLRILPSWSQRAVAAIAGIDRDEDYFEAEREEPACIMSVTREATAHVAADARFVETVRRGRWFGRASQLSEEHVVWTFIDQVARATDDPGHVDDATGRAPGSAPPLTWKAIEASNDRGLDARAIILQRRSAVALDGRSFVDKALAIRMLARALPAASAPWDALWWSPRIHLVLFVHRVTGLESGLYLLARDQDAVPHLKTALSRRFRWEPVLEDFPLWLLDRGDYRFTAKRLSCDQDIAADGFFSLGMLADFEVSLRDMGPSFYRQLFWESGVIGQVLYLEAEAAGARATGIGCFYDDPVHDLLGIEGHAFQSLYHFTVGVAVEDMRLTTQPSIA
jgi:SagB-type dehydrogenase family enzyme